MSSDFIKSEKSHQTYQIIASFYSKKYLHLLIKGIIYGEKMRNSGIYNYDYDHSFFGKDF